MTGTGYTSSSGVSHHVQSQRKVGSKAIEGKDPRPSRDSDYYRKGDGGRGKGAKLLLFRVARGEKGKGEKGKPTRPFSFPLSTTSHSAKDPYVGQRGE